MKNSLFGEQNIYALQLRMAIIVSQTVPLFNLADPETIPEKASYWTQTQVELADIFQMFHLSANGLEGGMKCLLVRQ